jgi:ATP-binding cassette subfamily F protein 3
VHDGCVEEYSEDLEGYERWILSSYRQTEKRDVAAADTSRKEKRQQAASQRDKLRPLQRLVDKTEAEMNEVHAALQALREQLGDSALYTEQNRQTLAVLLKREGELKNRAAALEDVWLEQQQMLEEMAQ